MMRDPINKIIMEDIGLTVDKNNRVMDQDTRGYVRYNNKDMRYSSQNSVILTNNDMVFDPGSNKIVMSHVFNYYLGKVQEEDGTYVSMHYEKIREEDGASALTAKIDGKEYTTHYYNNESLKYAEMIKIINQSEDTDLSQYDSKITRKDFEKAKKKSVSAKKRKKVDFR